MQRLPVWESRLRPRRLARAALPCGRGESFAVETEDASSGILPTAARADRREPPLRQTLAGTSESGMRADPSRRRAKGDRVRIDIIEINVAATGWHTTCLRSTDSDSRAARCRRPFTVLLEHRDGRGDRSDRLRWRFGADGRGTLCCHRVGGAGDCFGPSSWGGNLDVADWRAGSSVFLNSYHDGGQIFVGDAHGCQGDGEYFGVATRAAPRSFFGPAGRRRTARVSPRLVPTPT